MWIMLSDCFLSIVDKDCGPDELLVRARRQGDIQRVFPDAEVIEDNRRDYLFRAVVPRFRVAMAVGLATMKIDYSNFKDSVADHDLHHAYMQVWLNMVELQPSPPYGSKVVPARAFLEGL